MKIRNGFVTNSSSSSFVVCFKDEERDKTTLMEDLKKNEDMTIYDAYKAEEIYDIVMKYIENEKKANRDGISNPEKFYSEIEYEIDSAARWDEYDHYPYSKKGLSVEEKVAERMNAIKEKAKDATTLAIIELDDHDDGSSEYVMGQIVGNGIVLASFSHH